MPNGLQFNIYISKRCTFSEENIDTRETPSDRPHVDGEGCGCKTDGICQTNECTECPDCSV